VKWRPQLQLLSFKLLMNNLALSSMCFDTKRANNTHQHHFEMATSR
jgi:hypothetical protein